jgi:neutral ceramidase
VLALGPKTPILLAALAVSFSGQAYGQVAAGFAEVDVTPAKGVPLGGYGGRLRRTGPDLNPFTPSALFQPSEGTRDPLMAQVLVLETGGPLVALVAVDAIGIEFALLADVARAARRAGVPLEASGLVMMASHTHSGTGCISRRLLWQLAATDRFNAGVHRRFVRTLTGAIVAAYARRKPALLGSVMAEVRGVTRNRRANTSSRVERGDVDPRLRILRVDDALSGEPIAALVNYAVHGTCLGDSNLKFSADVPGSIRREAVKRLKYPVLFSQGCLGDVAPSPGGERGLKVVGGRLGQAIAELAPTAVTRAAGVGLASSWHSFGAMRLHPSFGSDLGDQLDDATLKRVVTGVMTTLKRVNPRLREPVLSTRFRFTALRLGDVMLLLVPGEPIVELGAQIEAMARRNGVQTAWVVGLSNGHMGYLTTPAEYDQGGYEAWMTFFGRDTGVVVTGALESALRKLGL